MKISAILYLSYGYMNLYFLCKRSVEGFVEGLWQKVADRHQITILPTLPVSRMKINATFFHIWIYCGTDLLKYADNKSITESLDQKLMRDIQRCCHTKT